MAEKYICRGMNIQRGRIQKNRAYSADKMAGHRYIDRTFGGRNHKQTKCSQTEYSHIRYTGQQSR